MNICKSTIFSSVRNVANNSFDSGIRKPLMNNIDLPSLVSTNIELGWHVAIKENIATISVMK